MVLPAATPRAFSLRSNRCATRSKLLVGSCVPGQGLLEQMAIITIPNQPAATARAFSLRSNRCATRSKLLAAHASQARACPDRWQSGKEKTTLLMQSGFFFNRQLSILPGRFQPSTFDVWGLNYCVRDGNRWIPPAIATGFFEKAKALKTSQKRKQTIFFVRARALLSQALDILVPVS